MTTFDDEITQSFAPNRGTVEVRAWGAATSTGHIRLENEDSWGHLARTRFALADGMGGTKGGLLAAESSVQGFLDVNPANGWVPELVALNRRVCRICQRAGFTNAGATLIGLEIERHRCVTVHIGDSRIYRLRQNILQLLTADHNLRNLRIEEGLDPEMTDERGTPRALTSWVGAPEEPDRIDVGTLSVQEGDRILLVSDGVSDQLTSMEIESVLIEHSSPEVAAQVLVERSDNAGGKDNATALVADLGVND